MKYTKLLLFFIAACSTLLSSCGVKSEKEIEDEISTGVVLVQNQSYYELELSNGQKLYFSSFDKKEGIQGLATEEDSVTVATSYGTGFFISTDGQIATNAHVVSNTFTDKDVNKSVSDIIEALKQVVEIKYNEYDEKCEEAQQYYDYANYSSDVSYEAFYKVKALKEALEEVRDECVTLYRRLDRIKASETLITYHNNVSIAYNDTYVTNTTDFVTCVVTNTDTEHDLAIVQLKSKRTPEERFVFTVPETDPLEDYSWQENLTKRFSDDKNSKLFMCSFNLGPTLALTKEGIKSQFNSGTISQRTNDRLMYSIPTLPGSSGSPVVNHEGQLVAINYAGINGTQNFNYGIRVKHLRKLLQ